MAAAGSSIHDLPDELLELVLLRMRTPVCLLRAAATCKLWRRVIAGDDSFLHRLRSGHRPNHYLLGHYYVNTTWEPGFVSRTVTTEFVPFPVRPAVHLRQFFSLDFLIDDGEYTHRSPVLTDSRGGLLAFVRDNCYAIVCDPWTRQYRELEFPWGRSVQGPGDRECWYDCLGAFILDADDGDGNEKSSLMSSFSVLCVCLVMDEMDATATAEACVFSAREDAWIRWTVSSDFYTRVTTVDMDQRFVGRAGGFIFFSGIENGRALLVLDETTGNFSTISLPSSPDVYDPLYYVDWGILRVVDGGGAGTGTLVLHIVVLVKSDLVVLKITRAQHGDWECTVERIVDLWQLAKIESRWWENRLWRFLNTTSVAAATLVLIGAFPPSTTTLLFSFDVKTMKLQPANKMTTTLNAKRVFPYELPWPQTINSL